MFNQFEKQVKEKGYKVKEFPYNDYIVLKVFNDSEMSVVIKQMHHHLYIDVNSDFPLELFQTLKVEMAEKALFINYKGHQLCPELETLGFQTLINRVNDPLFFTFAHERVNLYVFEKDPSYIDEKMRYSHPIFKGVQAVSNEHPYLELKGVYFFKEPIAFTLFQFNRNGRFSYDYSLGKYDLKVFTGFEHLHENPGVLEERIYEHEIFFDMFDFYLKK